MNKIFNYTKSKLQAITKKLWLSIIASANESESQFVPLGIIGCIGFAIYYFIWHDVAPTAYENMPLRIIAILLCMGLVLKNYWPQKLKIFLPIYWYLTLFYIMPFFFTFMVLKNNFSNVWIQNSMTALFFMILLVDWLALVILITTGVFAGTCLYYLTTIFPQTPDNIIGIVLAYLAVIGIAGIFLHNKETVKKEKLQSMANVSASIAHELRTPFAALTLVANSMKKYFNILLDGYVLAKTNALSVHSLTQNQLELLKNIPLTIEKESRSANLFIDLLIRNLNPNINEEFKKNFSISTCIKQALERYPFNEEQQQLIHWQDINDFTVKGDEILLIHLLFNLIKNALYYLAKASKKTEKGIYIWTEKTATDNKLYFKDTGTGIAKDILPFIFNRFFSKTKHGSGIGLTYCKMVMESLGGSITCESEINDYTLFIMTFPVINN